MAAAHSSRHSIWDPFRLSPASDIPPGPHIHHRRREVSQHVEYSLLSLIGRAESVNPKQGKPADSLHCSTSFKVDGQARERVPTLTPSRGNMPFTIGYTTLECAMKMQACHLLWHKATLKLVAKRHLADCSPSREVLVLQILRPRLFGGELEIELGASVHPVRMLPVSGKDVRRLRFGLVYGPKRKRVRFRAPNAASYNAWEMILEAAVEKAATERPTFPTWSCQCTSPSLSVDAGYVSEEFGFLSESGRESEDNAVEDDSKAKLHAAAFQNPLTGSFVDFIDSASSEGSANEADDELPLLETIHSECEAPLGSFDRSILAMYRRMSRQSREKRSKSRRKEQEATAPQCLEVALYPEAPCAQRLHQPLGIQATRDTVVEYLAWLRRGFASGHENHSKDTMERTRLAE